MNKEIQAKWITALRSGNYVQGRGHLFNEGDCCLGVLCKVAIPERVLRKLRISLKSLEIYYD